MQLVQRLRRAVDGLPREASITLPVGTVVDWMEDPETSFETDLTVADVAEIFGKSEHTVRRWIREGDLQAYEGTRGYRITRESVRAFQDSLRNA